MASDIDEADYVAGLKAAGFEGVEVVKAREIEVPDEALAEVLGADALVAFCTSGAGLWRVTVRGTRPSVA